MAFTLTPAAGFPPASAEQFPPNARLQVQENGVNVGAADISAINFSTGLDVTRAGTIASVTTTVEALLANISSASFNAGMIQYLSTLIYADGSVGAYLRQRVSVKDRPYLAKGDGSTDDTVAIQNCINANPGKIIYFPPGNYKVTGTLLVQADSTELVGEKATISQFTVNMDTVRFQPTTAGSTSAFLNLPAIRGLKIVHTSAVYASHTSGAGIRFLQCNGYELERVSVNDAFEGITIQGGQLGNLSNFSVFAANGSYTGVDTALLNLRQAPVGAGFQPCFTVRLKNYHMSATLLRETCIRIYNIDGLQSSTCYVANGKVSLIKVAAERDSGYVAAVGFVNAYLDCVGTGKTPYGVDIPADAFTNAPVFHFQLGTGCYIGNCDNIAVLCRKAQLFTVKLEGAHILNTKQWAVDIGGTQGNTDVHITGCTFSSVGTAGATGGVRLNEGNSFNFSGNTFRGASNVGLLLGGTFNSAGLIAGNVNASNNADYSNAATINGGLTVAGNSSLFSGASENSWLLNTALKLQNVASSDPLKLDWYEENNSWVPGVTFGGAAVGVTYSVQVGSSTRIGNRVHFTITITLTSKGSSVGVLLITGLPVTVNDVASPSCSLFITSVTSGVGDTALLASPGNGGTDIRLYKIAAGVAVQLTDADLTNTSNIHLEGTYRV